MRNHTDQTIYWFTVLCPCARHINPSLVLVQPRKTCLYITERLLMGCKESNQTGKIIFFLFLNNRHILWLLKRTISMRQIFRIPKQILKIDGLENPILRKKCWFQNFAHILFAGRYLFLTAIANQLRYPNSHTHYFSCTLLYLFAEANTEAIQEQITR